MSTAVQPATLIDLATAILRERDQLQQANRHLADHCRSLAKRTQDLEMELAELRGKEVEAPKVDGDERTYGWRKTNLATVLKLTSCPDRFSATKPGWSAETVHDLAKHIVELQAEVVVWKANDAQARRDWNADKACASAVVDVFAEHSEFSTPLECAQDVLEQLSKARRQVAALQAEIAALKQDRDMWRSVKPIGDVARVGDRVAFEWLRGQRIEGRIDYTYGDCAHVHVVDDNGSGYSTARKHIIAILDRAPVTECGPRGVDANGSPVGVGGAK